MIEDVEGLWKEVGIVGPIIIHIYLYFIIPVQTLDYSLDYPYI